MTAVPQVSAVFSVVLGLITPAVMPRMGPVIPVVLDRLTVPVMPHMHALPIADLVLAAVMTGVRGGVAMVPVIAVVGMVVMILVRSAPAVMVAMAAMVVMGTVVRGVGRLAMVVLTMFVVHLESFGLAYLSILRDAVKQAGRSCREHPAKASTKRRQTPSAVGNELIHGGKVVGQDLPAGGVCSGSLRAHHAPVTSRGQPRHKRTNGERRLRCDDDVVAAVFTGDCVRGRGNDHVRKHLKQRRDLGTRKAERRMVDEIHRIDTVGPECSADLFKGLPRRQMPRHGQSTERITDDEVPLLRGEVIERRTGIANPYGKRRPGR
jgi:hypothetical protein